MKTLVRNLSRTTVTLTGGATLAAGNTAVVDLSQVIEATALAQGVFMTIPAIPYNGLESYRQGSIVYTLAGAVHVAKQDVPAGLKFGPGNATYWTSTVGAGFCTLS